MSEIAASHPQQRSLALTPTPTPPRGPYTKIDFAALATQDADFARIWAKAKAEKSRNDHGHGHAHAHAQLDFQDAETCQVLTKALLRVDFGLSVEVPPDRLCPPVPGRWAYACWVGRLVRETETGGERRGREKEGSMDWETATREQKKIVGLDIGTGASAIYALLLLKANPDWHMCVTDTDPKSFDYAAANIARNGLGDRTTMLRTTGEGRVIPLGDLGVERLDFTICNPPFFADQKEMSDSLRGEGKKKAPNAVCTGSASEMVCSGGDLGFVTRIVEESLVLREKVRWYTSMLGKMSSAKAVVGLLKEKGVRNWAVGCLEPGAAGGGGGTKRWVVAWSFGDRRPANDIARTPSFPPELLPFPTQFTIPLSPTSSIKAVTDALSHYLLTLDLSRWTWHADSNTGIGEAPQNVWNRAYRRRREQAQQRQPRHKKRRTEDVSGDEEQAATHMDTEHEAEERERENPVALAFRIQIVDDEGPAVAKDSGNGTVAVVIDWLRGTDVLLWESFCGMVRRFVDGLPGVRPGHGAGGGATTKGGRDSAASGTKGEVLGSAGGNESVVTVLKRKRF